MIHLTQTVFKCISGYRCRYTLTVQDIRNTCLILSCTPLCPQNSLDSSVRGLHRVSKALHCDDVPCWLQCFPQLCQVGCMSLGWSIILDAHGTLLSAKKNSSIAVLDTFKPMRLAPTTIPRSYAFKYFVLSTHPLNGTHTQSMSQLFQGLKILLYPESSPSSTLI
jgi:hypothetical protein